MNKAAIAINGRHAATTRSAAGAGEERLVSLRVFDGHVHRLVLLLLAESVVVALALYAAILLRFSGFSRTLAAFELALGAAWPKFMVLVAVYALSLASLGLYQLRQRARFTAIVVRLVMAISVAHLALAVIVYFVPALHVGRGIMAITAGLAFAGLGITRFTFTRLVDENFFKRRVLVWGAGARAGVIARKLRRSTDQRGFRILGYMRAPGDRESVPSGKVLDSAGDLVRLALRHKVEEIVVAMDDRRRGFPAEDLLECRLRGIQVVELLSFLERESGRVDVEVMHPSHLIFSSGFRSDVLRIATKRLFDIAVSLFILIVSAPVSLLAALAIYLEDRGPIFYRQRRVGQNSRVFTILKFRSMRVDAEGDGRAVWAQQGDDRITAVGAVIRKLRIDEVPQAINVLLGHMSFVGPRPERPEFVEKLAASIPFYRERHFVKPGITGWAQVRYSYGASARDALHKLEYDLYYVKHHSLAFDLMVLLLTVEIVLFRIGSR